MGRFLEKRSFLTIVFLLYAAVTLWTTLHHEPWRDEADPWLLMRDGDAEAIFGLTAYRGTPLLWYLLIWPFAAVGAPYLAQQLLNLALAWAAVALVLRSRAFPPLVKALFAFSYYPAFEYSVIARNYALLMFLTFLAAEQWRARQEKPLRLAATLALLANTSVHGLILAGIAGALWGVETWSRPPAGRSTGLRPGPLLTLLAGILLSLVQLWPRPGGQTLRYRSDVVDTVAYALSTAFFAEMRTESALIPALMVAVLIVVAIRRHPVPLAFFLGTSAALLTLFVLVWMGGPRHAGILLVVAVASLWIADAYGPYRRERLVMAALAVALGWSVIPAARAWVEETRWAYSGSREAAEAIRKTGRKEIAAKVALHHAVAVYLPEHRFWYAATGEYGSYTRWDRQWERSLTMPAVTAVTRAEEHFGNRPWLLLLTEELPPSKKARFRLIYRTNRRVWGKYEERYWLYEPALSGP